MGYNETTWATGDVITAEKLNNIESGVSKATTLVADYYYDSGKETYYSSAKFGDIRGAFLNGTPVFLTSDVGSDEGGGIAQMTFRLVNELHWQIFDDSYPDGAGASGDFIAGNMSWCTDATSSPKTLEELDECTIYAQ